MNLTRKQLSLLITVFSLSIVVLLLFNLHLGAGQEDEYVIELSLADEDLEVISEYVNNYVEKFNDEHEGIELSVTFDFKSLLDSRLNLLINNGGIGLLLVVVSLAMFLSFRLSLWVAWGIPASFLGGFARSSAGESGRGTTDLTD